MKQTNAGQALSVVSMKTFTTLTCMIALAGAVTVGAQSSETTTKTKVDVKDGKDVKVTGCVMSDGSGYMLTNVADKDGAVHSYLLVSDSDDFSKLIGQRVQIEGTVADSHHGKVEIKTWTHAVDGLTESDFILAAKIDRLL